MMPGGRVGPQTPREKDEKDFSGASTLGAPCWTAARRPALSLSAAGEVACRGRWGAAGPQNAVGGAGPPICKSESALGPDHASGLTAG